MTQSKLDAWAAKHADRGYTVAIFRDGEPVYVLNTHDELSCMEALRDLPGKLARAYLETADKVETKDA